MLVCAPLAAHGELRQVEQAEPEFLDFLEYLGSWEGEEQVWVEFLEEEAVPARREADREQAGYEDSDDVVS